jgi:hypothetical protein
MPELIQFDCPSCAETLRIPLEMAGLRGPCPICHRDIVAPNPYTGIGAHFPPHQPMPEIGPVEEIIANPPPQPAQEIPASNHPFGDRLIPSEPVSDPLPASPAPATSHFPSEQKVLEESPPRSRAGAWAFACLCLILLALAAGFFIGNHFRPDPAKEPLIFPAKVTKPSAPPPAVPPPSVDPATKVPSVPPVEKPAPVNKTSLESAQATLKAFLEAPDWAARSAYVLSPNRVRPKMEAYARNNNDGSTPFTTITVEHSQVDAASGTTLFIFKVESPAVAGGIPVAVLETKKAWLVDWESFVEFRDDQFKEFSEGPSDHVGEFHVIVTAPDSSAGNHVENETYASFVVAPPLPGRQKTAFIKKSNPFYTQLRDATLDGRPFAPVLKITKATTQDGRSYLEILSIEASDWRPRGATPEP